MKNLFWQTILKNGLYAGGILAGYFLILYLLGVNFFSFGFLSFFIQAVVVIYFMLTGISQVRKMTEDKTIKYPSAFMVAFSIMLLGLICFIAMELFVIFVLDPAYLQSCVQELKIEMTKQLEANPQLAEYVKPDDITKLLELSTYMVVFLKFLIKSLVVGALIALIAKKKDRLTDSLNA